MTHPFRRTGLAATITLACATVLLPTVLAATAQAASSLTVNGSIKIPADANGRYALFSGTASCPKDSVSIVAGPGHADLTLTADDSWSASGTGGFAGVERAFLPLPCTGKTENWQFTLTPSTGTELADGGPIWRPGSGFIDATLESSSGTAHTFKRATYYRG